MAGWACRGVLTAARATRAGAPYLPLLPQFRALFPGVDPTPLVASVLFFAPIIRDFISWCGVRQVTPPSSSLCAVRAGKPSACALPVQGWGKLLAGPVGGLGPPQAPARR